MSFTCHVLKSNLGRGARTPTTSETKIHGRQIMRSVIAYAHRQKHTKRKTSKMHTDSRCEMYRCACLSACILLAQDHANLVYRSKCASGSPLDRYTETLSDSYTLAGVCLNHDLLGGRSSPRRASSPLTIRVLVPTETERALGSLLLPICISAQVMLSES